MYRVSVYSFNQTNKKDLNHTSFSLTIYIVVYTCHMTEEKMTWTNENKDQSCRLLLMIAKPVFQKTLHEFHETCHAVTFIVLVNSHQR